MSSAIARLISDFESLPLAEKQEFAREFFLRLPPIDSGELEDDLVAAAGDQMATMLQEDEDDSRSS